MELGEFDKNEVLDRLNNVQRLSMEASDELKDLLALKENTTRLAEAKLKVGELYDGVLSNLQNCDQGTKAPALDARHVRFYASADKLEIQGVIPLELPTIARTWGCLPFHAYVSIGSVIS